jgi:hypothetical protein
MSLNRAEQRLFDYIQAQAEERQYWMRKVQSMSAEAADPAEAAARLDRELWRYNVERSAVVPVLREAASREGMGRVSMRNLAELILRLWTAPKPTRINPANN